VNEAENSRKEATVQENWTQKKVTERNTHTKTENCDQKRDGTIARMRKNWTKVELPKGANDT
jgi:hypothetical protein